MRSLTDLLRDMRDHGVCINYQNSRGTVEGRPVIWRKRFVDYEGEHAWVSFTYENWPPDGSYSYHFYGYGPRDLPSIDPVTSVEGLWAEWERIKTLADQPYEAPAPPEPVGQLDMFDLLAVQP